MAFDPPQALRVAPSAMRSAAWRWASAWLVALVALLALCAWSLWILPRDDPQPLPVLTAKPNDSRIVYPPGRYPILTLPDGQREMVRSLLAIERPLHFGDYVWDDAGVPPGPVWVRVDLTLQTLSVFRAGHEIGSTLILFRRRRQAHAGGRLPDPRTRRTPSLDALRCRDAVHAAPHARWRRDPRQHCAAAAATHGCIGVPLQFARLLFAQARRGDRVAILNSR